MSAVDKVFPVSTLIDILFVIGILILLLVNAKPITYMISEIGKTVFKGWDTLGGIRGGVNGG